MPIFIMEIPETDKKYKVGISNRQILRMTLPISFAILVPQLNFITNNVFLGNLSEGSLATAGITGVYYLLFAAIGNGMNSGLQALIARRAGEGRIAEIGRLFSQSLLIVLGMAFLGILLTYTVAPAILRYSLKEESIYRQAIHFLQIRILGLPFLYIYQMRNALLVGTNQSRFLLYGTLAEAFVNIILDYGLIYGHFGLPVLGFDGAAVASILAEAAGLVMVFAVIRAKGIGRELQLSARFYFDAGISRLILRQSAPLVFQYAISIISWIFFYILIEHHGSQDLAISNTMRNIFGLFGAFTWAFASTTNAMVSNVIGQGKKERVGLLIRKIVKMSLGFSVIVAGLLNLFPRAFLAVYGQDASFVSEAIPVVRIVSSALILMSFSTIWLNAVAGTGNTRITLQIEAITIVFYCIYVYLILERWNLPLFIGWTSEWVYWLSTFGFAYAYIRSGKWKDKTI